MGLKLNADRAVFLKEIKEILEKRSDELYSRHETGSTEEIAFEDGRLSMLDSLIYEISDILENTVVPKNEIQAGQYVYVITGKKAGKSYEMLRCYVLKKIVKSNSNMPKYRISGHYADGEYYESTITEKAVGVTMFTDKEEAEQALAKKNR